MLFRAAAGWFLLLVIAFVAAGLRVRLLEPGLGEATAHRLGSVAVAILFAVVIWTMVPWIDPALDARRLGLLGLGWTAVTIGFEFGFGHYVMGHPWSRLLRDYDPSRGRLWALVLLVVLLGPSVVGLARG